MHYFSCVSSDFISISLKCLCNAFLQLCKFLFNELEARRKRHWPLLFYYRVYLFFFFFLLWINIVRDSSDYVTADDEQITSRGSFCSRKEALSSRANGTTDSLSILVKKRIIALLLHTTRLRAIQTRKKSDGFCIVWSISDRACFIFLNV